jgi:hypothetical protein
MEVIFPAGINGHDPVLALHFLSEKDGINRQLFAHKRSSNFILFMGYPL